MLCFVAKRGDLRLHGGTAEIIERCALCLGRNLANQSLETGQNADAVGLTAHTKADAG